MREYLTCIDELTTISIILEKKINVFEGLQRDLERLDEEDVGKEPNNPAGESANERVAWALETVKEQFDGCQRLLTDLGVSMNGVCLLFLYLLLEV